MLLDGGEALVQLLRLVRRVDRRAKQVDEPGQAELVHVVDARQVVPCGCKMPRLDMKIHLLAIMQDFGGDTNAEIGEF